MTGVDYKGVPAGEYVVLVSKTELSPSEVGDLAPKDPNEFDHWREARQKEKRVTYTFVKPEFGNVKTSPLSITISKGKNEAAFDVGEPIRDEIK